MDRQLTRRGALRASAGVAAGLAGLALLAACGGAGQAATTVTTSPTSSAAVTSASSAPVASASATGSSAASSSATGSSAIGSSASVASASAVTSSVASSTSATSAAAPVASASTATSTAVVIKPGMTPVRLWVHWGGQSLALLQKIVDQYNSSEGAKDKIQVVVETVDDTKWTEKMTAAKLGGDPPEIYHTWVSAKVLSKNQFADPLPPDEGQYVKQNYYPGAVDRLTLGGKIWGYPTEYQALGYIYRKSFYQEAGLSTPPANTDDMFEYAQKLNRKDGATINRLGFTIFYDRLPQNFATWIARFGGQMYSFDGDHPTKVDVASPQAIDVVTYWKKLIDAGVTEVGTPLSTSKAWQQSQAATAEIEVWFPLSSIRNPGKTDVFQDLGATAVVPRQGTPAVSYAYGYGLIAANGTKHPDERTSAMKWLMHKPAMPFSRHIVENIGSMPAPTEYPTPIPGWTDDLSRGYAQEAPKIAQANPEEKILGADELAKAYTAALDDILKNKTTVQSGLSEVNPRLNDILKRTDPT